MNYQEMQQLIEQYKSSGGDMADFESYVNSRASNGTTSLGLNQWQSSDKPVMEDFNRDNRIIDQEIRSLREELAGQKNMIGYLSSELKQKVSINSEVPYPTDTVTNFGYLPNGYCRVNGAMEGAPETPFNGQVFTWNDGFGMITQFAAKYSGKRYYRDGNSGTGIWNPWKGLVEAD